MSAGGSALYSHAGLRSGTTPQDVRLGRGNPAGFSIVPQCRRGGPGARLPPRHRREGTGRSQQPDSAQTDPGTGQQRVREEHGARAGRAADRPASLEGNCWPRCTAPFLTTPRSWAQTFQPRRTSLGQRPFPLADSLFIPPPRNKKGCPMMEHHFQEQARRRASYAKDMRTIPAPEGFHIQGCVSPAQCGAMKRPPSWYGKAALVHHSACTNYSIRQSISAQVKHCRGKPAVCLPRHRAG